jgi:hypothetical protein
MTDRYIENPAAERIQDLLDAQQQDWMVARNDPSEYGWFHAFLAKLTLAVGGDEIIFLSSRHSQGSTGFDGVVAIFTPDRLVFGYVGGEQARADSLDRVEVVTISRDRLTRIDFESKTTPFASTWQNGVAVAVTYDDDRVGSFALPLSGANKNHSPALIEFLPSLLADVR